MSQFFKSKIIYIAKMLFSVSIGFVCCIVILLGIGLFKMLMQKNSPVSTSQFDSRHINTLPEHNFKYYDIIDNNSGITVSCSINEKGKWKSYLLLKHDDPNFAFLVGLSPVDPNYQMFIYGRDGICKFVDYNFDGKFDLKGIDQYRYIKIQEEWIIIDQSGSPSSLTADGIEYGFDVLLGKWQKITNEIKND